MVQKEGDDSAWRGQHLTDILKDVEACPDHVSNSKGQLFPLAHVGAKKDSITQAHVGKGRVAQGLHEGQPSACTVVIAGDLSCTT